MSLPVQWVVPDWPAPANVRAFATTRAGGVSEGEYASLNLGMKSGDDVAKVERNRAIVREHLPAAPRWLAQVHGIRVGDLDRPDGTPGTADASRTSLPGRVAVVQTADCMPLLLCDAAGRHVSAVHAGWRGMAAGIIENAVARLGAAPAEILAWMGPTIGPDAFEVGPEVREAFLQADPGADEAFRAHLPGKFMADLYALARRRLAIAGVERVHGGGFCTFHEPQRFFSYRRVKSSGRMASFIWMAP
jgi:YfiH family protein